ncbi:ABC transporter substrate-binding protein [Amorphus orientalis]|uniref:NitT/TauT family transport system substrate-binding protein n=1 Tax=Amorphus orientalis TaxID=649198 RepID=A0AAE3VTE1_9HYPH|nr:ABC transporter substrate-binding protein [Amorphus orientalis]MDQ0317256.1 NitT/TauT family transport system substrate-binding protein [Amorphus orientalis]
MKTLRKLATVAAALLMMGGAAAAQSKVTLAIGGAGCLCYLPTVLTKQLGNFEKAGLDVDMVNFKGGSQALKAVIGGSADVVSGYFDHTVALAAKGQHLKAIVVYDRFPGLVIVVSPDQTGEIKTIADLKGKTVGISAPGSSTDYFLKYQLQQAGLERDAASVIGVGLGGTAIAAMEQGQIDAAVMLDPAVTVLETKYPDLTLLADTRTEKDTRAVFGGDYPGGAIYTKASWIEDHPEEAQALVNAMVATLDWIHSHTPEEIMAEMPEEMVGNDKEAYLAALKNTMSMYSETGMMDPKGAEAVLKVFSAGDPAVRDANIDITTTYTNAFVEKAHGK